MAIDTKYGQVNVKGVPDNEPIFILRGQDIFAIHLLKFYRSLRESSGDVAGERSVGFTIDAFKSWMFKKVPD